MPQAEFSNCDETVRLLMRRALDGDSSAMTKLIKEFTPLVTGVAYSITRNRHGAEDIALEAIVIWTRCFKEFIDNTNLSCQLIRKWLKVVATRLAWAWVKKNPPPEPFDEEYQAPKQWDSQSVSEITHIRQRDKCLNECIDSLSSPDALVLRIWMGNLKLEAIADFLIFAGEIARVQVFVRKAISRVKSDMAVMGYNLADGW